MASPFTVFRRKQKVLLAIFGVAIMIAFTFQGVATRWTSSSAGRHPGSVVAESRYGKMTDAELRYMVQRRQAVAGFLKAIVVETTASVDNPNLRQAVAEQSYQQLHDYVMGRSTRDPARAAVETMLMAKKAGELGIVVSDRAINEFLKVITSNKVKGETFDTIIRKLRTEGGSMSQEGFFDAMRTELLATELRQMFITGLNPETVPPYERWNYFCRLNRRVTAEILPVKVSDLVDQVPDPSPEEVRKFFDEYKVDELSPVSPRPGFKEPIRASFQYFKFENAAFVEQAKEKITDEQIREYYEKNKATQFLADKISPKNELQPEADTRSDEPADKPETTEDEKPTADEPAKDNERGAQDAKQAPNAKQSPDPSIGEDSAEKKPVPPSDAPKVQPTGKPATGKPGTGKAVPAKKGADNSARRSVADARDVKIILTAAQAQKQPAAKGPAAKAPPAPRTTAPAAPKPSSPAAPAPGKAPAQAPPAKIANEKPADAKSTEKVPADRQSPSDAAAANKAESADKSQDDSSAAKEKDAEAGADKTDQSAGGEQSKENTGDDESAEASKYKPLKEVEDQIRDHLAQAEADKAIADVMNVLTAHMRRYSDAWSSYNARKTPGGPQPVALKFDELAKANGVRAFEAALITPLQAAEDSDIGKSYTTVPVSSFQSRRLYFSGFAFSDSLKLFKSTVTLDDENNRYLFWKTKSVESHVPELNDALRAKVVREWKMVRARELARKQAQQLATKANQSHQSLEDVAGSDSKNSVAKIGPLTWMTVGSVAQDPMNNQPHYTDIPEAKYAGEEFMRTVFSLPVGDAGVAMDQPQTVAYVVRAIEFNPSLDELQNDFATKNYSQYIAVAFQEQQPLSMGWIGDLEKEAGLKWVAQFDNTPRSRAAPIEYDDE